MAKPLPINYNRGHNINGSNILSIGIYPVACPLDRLFTFPTSFSSDTEHSSRTFIVKFRMCVAFFRSKAAAARKMP